MSALRSRRSWKSLHKADWKAISKIIKIEITGGESRVEEWLDLELHTAIGSDVKIEWVLDSMNVRNSVVVAVQVITLSGVVRLE